MASTIDAKQALRAMATVLTAFTSATGVSSTTFAASLLAQVSADTGLSAQESTLVTLITTSLWTATPSSAINKGLSGVVDSRTLFATMVSVLTALSSATGTSTTNFNTALQAQITADTGLTTTETKMINTLSSGLASATPSTSAHNWA